MAIGVADELVYAALAQNMAARLGELGTGRVGEALFAGWTYPGRGFGGRVGLVGKVDRDQGVEGVEVRVLFWRGRTCRLFLDLFLDFVQVVFAVGGWCDRGRPEGREGWFRGLGSQLTDGKSVRRQGNALPFHHQSPSAPYSAPARLSAIPRPRRSRTCASRPSLTRPHPHLARCSSDDVDPGRPG